MSVYIFGYGSLLNGESRNKTIRDHNVIENVTIYGYQRKFNAPVNGHVYLNLIEKKDMSVTGVILEMSDECMEALKLREVGYTPVDISKHTDSKVAEPIYTFIAPDRSFPDHTLLQSYLNTCLAAVPEPQREKWIRETIIENIIVDDT